MIAAFHVNKEIHSDFMFNVETDIFNAPDPLAINFGMADRSGIWPVSEQHLDLDKTLEAIQSQSSDDSNTDHCQTSAEQFSKLRLVTDAEIAQLKLGNVPQNTLKKRNWAMNKFDKWRQERNNKLHTYYESTTKNAQSEQLISCKPLYEFSIPDLNYALCRFIAEIRTHSAENIRPKTLLEVVLQLQQAINANLNSTSYRFLSDPQFKEIKGTLDSIMCKNSQLGLNFTAKRADVITPEMEDILWHKTLLGDNNPHQLINTMIYLNGIHFALRGGTEQWNLSTKNFQLVTENGSNNLVYREFATKSNQGGIKTVKNDPKVVTAYQNTHNPSRCIVRIFQKFMSLRPANVEKFYLRPLDKIKPDVWFSRQVIGIHTIEKTVTSLCKNAGFTGHFTTHSLRATSATRMFQSGIDEQVICEVTGHRSSAVRLYKRTSDSQKKQACKALQESNTLARNDSVSETANSIHYSGMKQSKMTVEIDGNAKNIKVIFD